MSNPTASILIIGSEMLSGRTQDTNIQYIASGLSTRGIIVHEARIIPDQEDVIIDAVLTLSKKSTYVFTTGGIGATHDDITAASIAKAFKRKLGMNSEALDILVDYYKDQLNDARKRMALIPEGASLIYNPVSGAPGFRIENVFCLAGIPAVMKAMFDAVVDTLSGGDPIYSKIIHCLVPENTIADELGEIQKQYPTIEIGSYPRFIPPNPKGSGTYSLSLVVRGLDVTQVENVTEEILGLLKRHGDLARVESYGQEDETLKMKVKKLDI